MKRCGMKWIMMVLLLCGMQTVLAQKINTLVITDDRLVLTIGLQSRAIQLDSIFGVAGVSGVKVAALEKGDFSDLERQGWSFASRQGDAIVFSRMLDALKYNPRSRPYEITTSIPSIDGKPGYPAEVKYGVNKYAKVTAYELSSGLTRFILPGYGKARRVFLSGNFNQWSTLRGLMNKTEGGWLLDVKLEPGAYEYKYIVDGGWRTDPNNLLRVNDGNGNMNSVYFKYNYTFRLTGYAQAQRIVAAGDFNEWDANDLIMERKGSVWERPMYLAEGKYLYRFMVDGKWISDPANPVKMQLQAIARDTDKFASLNSILRLGEPVTFKLEGFSEAKKVVLLGNFDGYDEADLHLRKKGNDWVLPLSLTAGNYDYRFMVDDKVIRDPANPHYSIIAGEEWSFVAIKPNYTFRLEGHDSAKKVTMCSLINNWEPNGYTMSHKGGQWTLPFHLKPGKYLYKFRVDGNWIIDPGNSLWEENEEHTGNSVLWIE